MTGNGNVSGGAGAINCGNGGIICSATNATVTLIASPSTGATFTGWTGARRSGIPAVLMNSPSVTATFVGGIAGGAGFLLTVSVSGAGITGQGSTAATARPRAPRLRP